MWRTWDSQNAALAVLRLDQGVFDRFRAIDRAVKGFEDPPAIHEGLLVGLGRPLAWILKDGRCLLGLGDPDHALLFARFSAAQPVSSIARRSSALSPDGRVTDLAFRSPPGVGGPCSLSLGLASNARRSLSCASICGGRALPIVEPRTFSSLVRIWSNARIAQDLLDRYPDHHVIALAAQQQRY